MWEKYTSYIFLLFPTQTYSVVNFVCRVGGMGCCAWTSICDGMIASIYEYMQEEQKKFNSFTIFFLVWFF